MIDYWLFERFPELMSLPGLVNMEAAAIRMYEYLHDNRKYSGYLKIMVNVPRDSPISSNALKPMFIVAQAIASGYMPSMRHLRVAKSADDHQEYRNQVFQYLAIQNVAAATNVIGSSLSTLTPEAKAILAKILYRKLCEPNYD